MNAERRSGPRSNRIPRVIRRAARTGARLAIEYQVASLPLLWHRLSVCGPLSRFLRSDNSIVYTQTEVCATTKKLCSALRPPAKRLARALPDVGTMAVLLSVVPLKNKPDLPTAFRYAPWWQHSPE